MCHGPSVQMNGLRLDRKQEAMAGSLAGPVIVAGNSGGSSPVERIASGKDGYRMPPSGPPLKPEEIARIRAWIDAGADWPEEAVAAAPSEEQRRGHWSFQPMRHPAVPAVKHQAWPRNPIDRFTLARLEAERMESSGAADPVTLIRRLSLDLIGLPARVQVNRIWQEFFGRGLVRTAVGDWK